MSSDLIQPWPVNLRTCRELDLVLSLTEMIVRRVASSLSARSSGLIAHPLVLPAPHPRHSCNRLPMRLRLGGVREHNNHELNSSALLGPGNRPTEMPAERKSVLKEVAWLPALQRGGRPGRETLICTATTFVSCNFHAPIAIFYFCNSLDRPFSQENWDSSIHRPQL